MLNGYLCLWLLHTKGRDTQGAVTVCGANRII